jgi:PAS domain S-box-containing protein
MLPQKKIHILIIDDDEEDFQIIRDYIDDIEGSDFVIDWCPDYNEAIQKVKAHEYDLYFVDYRLDYKTGLELLQQVGAESSDQPIVLLTGKGNKAIDVKAMEYGATDYLVKSELSSEKLDRCIRYSLERADSLKELKTRENKYRNLFEGSKDAVFITDENLGFIEVNHAACNLFGLTQKDLFEKNLFEFIKGEVEKNKINQLLHEKEKFSGLEIEIDAKDITPCMLSVTTLKTSDNQKLYHGIIHDISNIKKAEIANLQAQKLAANERLMRILAHEIRNPLNNISLSIDHLEFPQRDEEKTSRLMEILKRNTVRINQIITELLDLTRPQELKFEDLSLQEILDESISMAIDRISLRQIKLQKTYPASPLKIVADKRKLSIAFSNILINAIEAMESNKGELTVALSALPNSYSVSIKDNGKGIPEEYMQKLFEPFFTLKPDGIGLGLATSYSIIQSHKGNVQVESTPNVGTHFIISFSNTTEPVKTGSKTLSSVNQ